MAKFLRLSCALAIALLFLWSNPLSAQSFSGNITEYPSMVLNTHFSTYQVAQLDATAIDAYVKSNAASPAQINVGGHQWKLDLELTPLFSDYYSLVVQTPLGTKTTYEKPKIAYRGYETNGGGRVRLTLHGEFMYGFVEEGQERFYIEPLWYYEPDAPRNLFVIYPKSGVNPAPENACGVIEEETKLEHFEDSAVNNADNSDCYEVELAIASDKSMHTKYGSVSAVQDHNVAVINDVEVDYTGNFNHDLTFVIVTQFVVTGTDPWTNSTDAGTLLGSFQGWGNNGGFGVSFDIGELWTNRDFDGGTIGIAYLNGVCNNQKYHCLQDFSSDGDLLRCMTSHEIGHNFSAVHDNCPPGSFIMCPFVSNSNTWSTNSTNSINSYMQSKINSGCLTSCGPPAPPLVADFDWSPNPGCQGQAVNFTDLSTGNITGWSWTFQGGSPPTSTQQNPSVIWNSAGTKTVTLSLTGVNGPASVTKTVDISPLPVAGFTYTVSGLTVTFTNTSTNATSYEWDFGDGGSSFDANPVYEYPVAGTYVVVLTATNSCGTSTKSYTVNTAPTADFTASPTSGCAALVVTMDNQSSSNAVSFTWSFPGGAPSASNQPNPTVVYSIAGTYSISLTATNSSGSNTFTRTDYITVNATPAANFTTSVNGATVTFTNTTIGSATSYLWDFGDGTTSTQANPVHTYANSGTYDVTLTATNACGSSIKTKSVTVTVSGPPVASFTATPSVGCAPLTVNFTSTSQGAASYNWDFPGGTPASSTNQNPTVVYNTAGTYTVTLTVSNANGNSTATSTITVNTVPTAGYTYTVSNDSTYSFTNTSTGATSYIWAFGDGDSSTVASPVHDYPAIDSIIHYSVIMHAINDCGTVSDTQVVTVITKPHANFTATPVSGCAPLTVQFNNTSAPNATAYHWLFPGGVPDTSILKNPMVVYPTAGTYTVTLIVSNPAGRDTFIRQNYIVVSTVPTVGFTSAATGLTYTFTNTSSGATSYAWDFGDGGNSTDTNPTHTYAADGTYTVTLSATNACGTTTSTQSVVATTPPVAGFSASANSGCAPLSVTFTNTSSSNATSFDWQFPGGNPSSSNEQNPPSVVYDLPGTYTVTLTVSNAAGSSTYTQSIVVGAGPTANFSSTVSVLDVTFTNNSSNSTSYNWDFGDGNNSSDPNPTHTYAGDGTYTVVLTATNNCGTSTFTQNVVVTTEPSAGFSASTTSGCAPLTVQFTDISAGAPVSWSWEFPGGTPATSTEENPTVQYFFPGVYDVTLVVTSAGGSTSSFTQQDLITVYGPPTAGFTSTTNGNAAAFSNTSVDATSYIWNFGDGSNSTEESPTHTYANDGEYTVTLTAVNNCGSAIFEQTVTVSTLPVAGFNFNGSGCAPFTVQFNNTSSPNATSFLWDFPGGNPSTSTEENPTVVWTAAGVYTVTLTVSNTAGSSTSTATITVNAAPIPGFTYQVGGLTAIFTNTSTNGNNYLWNFGDGTTSTEANPTHTYGQTGTYMVILMATNDCGTTTITQTVTIQGNPPVPSITSNTTTGCGPFTVQFADQSAGNPTNWLWTFAGGQPGTSTEQNPTVVYTIPGTYDVVLTVGNAFGVSTQTFAGYITVQAPPIANFTYAANQTTVAFTNNSQNASSYVWNFGDGNTSTEQNPTHTYANTGTYTVTLAVSNNCGTAIFEQTIVITSGTNEAAWIEGFQLYPNPNTGVFTVKMNGLPQHEVEFALFNALGQRVKRETVDFATGLLVRNFNYGDLAAGVYMLRIQANGQAKFVKVTVNR